MTRSVWVGRVPVGRVEGKVYRKTLRASHLLRVPPAVAMDAATVRELEQLGVQEVELTMPDGELLRVPLSLWWSKGFPVERGHGKQLAVTLTDLHNAAPSRRRESAGAGGTVGRRAPAAHAGKAGRPAPAAIVAEQLRLCRPGRHGLVMYAHIGTIALGGEGL